MNEERLEWNGQLEREWRGLLLVEARGKLIPGQKARLELLQRSRDYTPGAVAWEKAREPQRIQE